MNKEDGGAADKNCDAPDQDHSQPTSVTNEDMDDVNIEEKTAYPATKNKTAYDTPEDKAAYATTEDKTAYATTKEAVTTDKEAEFKLGSNPKFVMSNLPFQKKEVVTRSEFV